MRNGIIYLFLVMPVLLTAQTPRIAGFVAEQNSGKKRVTGVLVGAHAPAKTNAALTTPDGDFMLSFQDMKPGEMVTLQAQKKDWVVVNEKEMTTGLPSQDNAAHFRIIMCTAATLQGAQKEYYEITDRYINEEFARQKAAVNRSISGWQAKEKVLQEQYDMLKKELSKIADDYSRTNMDDLTEPEKKAIELFRAGRINEAIQVRSNMNSADHLQVLKRKGRELDSVIAVHTRNLRTLAREYTLKFDFINADKTYLSLAEADTTNADYAMIYADFLSKQNKYDKEIHFCNMAMRHTTHPVKVIVLCQNLGTTYLKKNDLKQARYYLQRALQICNRLAIFAPQASELFKGGILMNLASLYQLEQDYKAEEEALLEARLLIKNTAPQNMNLFTEDLGGAEYALAELYRRQQRYGDAETAYQAALDIFRQQKNELRSPPEANMARVYVGLGIMYSQQRFFDKCVGSIQKAVDILDKLAAHNRDAFKPLQAQAYINLSSAFQELKNYAAAESAVMKAAALYQELVVIDKAIYMPELIMCRQTLAIIYLQTRQYPLAEKKLSEGLTMFNELSPELKRLHEEKIARALNNFGLFYLETKKFSAAESHYQAAEDIYSRLVLKNKAEFEPVLAVLQLNLAGALIVSTNYAKAAEKLQAARDIFERLAVNDKNSYTPQLAALERAFIVVYINTGRPEQAEKASVKCLQLYETLFKKDPLLYEADYAKALIGLGKAQMANLLYSEAEKKFAEGLKIYRKLVKQSPGMYEPDLLGIFDNMGNLYMAVKNFARAQEVLTESLAIAERRAQTDPEFSGINLILACNALAKVHMAARNFPEAQKVQLRALQVYHQMPAATRSVREYEEVACELYFNLGGAYYEEKQLAMAEPNFLQALEIVRRLLKTDKAKYGAFFCSTAMNLCSIYLSMPANGKKEQARGLIKEVQEVLVKLPAGQQKEEIGRFMQQLQNYAAQ